ncbi:MAG: hypothetical protein LBP53_00285, partial [Candidatus Peribacteria bacterium]|nr:hypothetical protein [Candidatus Peribacteria bacterium]
TCTATNGTQSRTVQCKGSDGSVVADNMCSGTKPGTSQTCSAGCSGISTSQTCNTSACTTYSWNS